jgi:hypothetical protein
MREFAFLHKRLSRHSTGFPVGHDIPVGAVHELLIRPNGCGGRVLGFVESRPTPPSVAIRCGLCCGGRRTCRRNRGVDQLLGRKDGNQ